jgi:hypothetical protein
MTELWVEIRRRCRRCGQPFTVTADEQVFLAQLHGRDYRVPSNCTPCRHESRVERYERPARASDNVLLTCKDCGSSFVFAGRDAEYWAEQSWPQPKRCRECRQRRRGGGTSAVGG